MPVAASSIEKLPLGVDRHREASRHPGQPVTRVDSDPSGDHARTDHRSVPRRAAEGGRAGRTGRAGRRSIGRRRRCRVPMSVEVLQPTILRKRAGQPESVSTSTRRLPGGGDLDHAPRTEARNREGEDAPRPGMTRMSSRSGRSSCSEKDDREEGRAKSASEIALRRQPVGGDAFPDSDGEERQRHASSRKRARRQEEPRRQAARERGKRSGTIIRKREHREPEGRASSSRSGCAAARP